MDSVDCSSGKGSSTPPLLQFALAGQGVVEEEPLCDKVPAEAAVLTALVELESVEPGTVAPLGEPLVLPIR